MRICFPEFIIFYDYLGVAWSICFIFNLVLWGYRLRLSLSMLFYEFSVELLMNRKLMGLLYFPIDFFPRFEYMFSSYLTILF